QRTLAGGDALVMPGGFSYRDDRRAGAIARVAPKMDAVATAAGGPEGEADGLPVLGICNGFQILTESHLLPGSMIKNDHLHFICHDQLLVAADEVQVVVLD
ncbi:phosphoribosylformylglycinamidine synthase subunit PurQ, partial [Micrococcus sp. F3Y]|uniref:phosphoribosylformylglycinamidine synthase subunit PurQ n=1 Tax=Micrococcus sp. F3Y TaxID=3402627 RepID=UPI003AF56959